MFLVPCSLFFRTAFGNRKRVLLQPSGSQPTTSGGLLPHPASGLPEADGRPAGRPAGRVPADLRDLHPGAGPQQRVRKLSEGEAGEDERNLLESRNLPADVRSRMMVSPTHAQCLF